LPHQGPSNAGGLKVTKRMARKRSNISVNPCFENRQGGGNYRGDFAVKEWMPVFKTDSVFLFVPVILVFILIVLVFVEVLIQEGGSDVERCALADDQGSHNYNDANSCENPA